MLCLLGMRVSRLISVFALSCSTAFAQQATFVAPMYDGSACSLDSASALLSPDLTSMNILFNDLVLRAGGASGRTTTRMTCDLLIYVNVPSGYRVSGITHNFAGTANLPCGAQASFSATYVMGVDAPNTYSQIYYGPMTSTYQIPIVLNDNTETWSTCGMSFPMAVNISIVVNADREGDTTLFAVDSDSIAIVAPTASATLDLIPCTQN